jgi:hypothetical protein
VKILIELGGTKKDKNNRNKTQAVAFSLLEHLPRKEYYCFIDNLFISERFLEFLRKQRYSATGICYTNSRVITELIDLKNSNKRNKLLWGILKALPTKSGKVIQVR